MSVNKLCRICLQEDKERTAMQPLFDEENTRCAEIVQRIEECGGIVLNYHEQFPTMICLQCLASLNTSYKFRSMCKASETTLWNTIVKVELKTEPLEVSSDQTIENPDTIGEEKKDEMSYVLRPDYIEGQVGDSDELSDIKPDIIDNNIGDDENNEYFAIDEFDGKEHFNDDDSESDGEFVPIPKKIKTESIDENKKLEAEKKCESTKEVRRGRGRNKKKAEPETHKCEICENTYTKRSLLNIHMLRHRAEKPFECEICGKHFTCPSEINNHMRIHTGEKPYACRFCGRTFADRSTKIKHERIHTKERPFTCQTCGKSFTYSNVLKNHMLTHTGEKPFSCIPCNKTFSRKHQLDQHLSTITHQQKVKN